MQQTPPRSTTRGSEHGSAKREKQQPSENLPADHPQVELVPAIKNIGETRLAPQAYHTNSPVCRSRPDGSYYDPILANAAETTMIGRMPEDSLHKMLDLAAQLAVEAGQFTTARTEQTTFTRKPDNSIVTATDHAIQERIISAIKRDFPGHAVFAEEDAQTAMILGPGGCDRYCWVIDPLDGTRNYLAGFPSFATSIGILEEGVPVVGAIYDHCIGRLYTGIRGGGAQCDGKPMSMVDPPDMEDLLVGVPSSKDELTVAVAQRWTATKGLICRNLGSTALHLALVAAGGLSASFCKQSKVWDIVAGMVLVFESGGVVTDPSGQVPPPFTTLSGSRDVPLVAAAQGIHRRLVDSISDLTSS